MVQSLSQTDNKYFLVSSLFARWATFFPALKQVFVNQVGKIIAKPKKTYVFILKFFQEYKFRIPDHLEEQTLKFKIMSLCKNHYNIVLISSKNLYFKLYKTCPNQNASSRHACHKFAQACCNLNMIAFLNVYGYGCERDCLYGN